VDDSRADKIGGAEQADYRTMTQGWRAFGAILGRLVGAQIASLLGRRQSYFLISIGSLALTLAMFQLTAPLQATFFPIVFAPGSWPPASFFTVFDSSYPAVGGAAALIYGLGIFAIWFAPDTTRESISE